MKNLNKTDTPIFYLKCVLCFQSQPFRCLLKCRLIIFLILLGSLSRQLWLIWRTINFIKKSYKTRFIANSSSCSTTELSKLLTSCLTAIKSHIQSTLVISNSLISNNRLSRSENLVPVLTQRSTNRRQNIAEKRRNCSLGAISPLFHNIFNISLT